MSISLKSWSPDQNSGKPVQVMVVDDSAIIRGFICRYLSEDKAIEIVGTANNGEVALRMMRDNPQIEVVVLDIEMPVMDGLTALPKMLEIKKSLQVVMASTLTKRNAEVSLKALQYGAMDYVPKPDTARSLNASIDFRREIVEKVKAWALRQRSKDRVKPPAQIDGPGAGRMAMSAGASAATADRSTGFVTARRPAAPTPTGFARPAVSRAAPVSVTSPRSAEAKSDDMPPPVGTPVVLRPAGRGRPKVLAVGSSTGGPQALMKFFAGFKKVPEVPVVITQHMPATFTAILAKHIHESTGWDVVEGKEGAILMPGHVYVAPGDYHMTFKEDAGKVVVSLNQGPQENFCRPSVDPMYRSLLEIYGDKILGVILTGMGHDGLKSARDVVKAGGTVFAQDEETSVVWGMPGAVATAGLCTKVLPIDQLGEQAERQLAGGY